MSVLFVVSYCVYQPVCICLIVGETSVVITDQDQTNSLSTDHNRVDTVTPELRSISESQQCSPQALPTQSEEAEGHHTIPPSQFLAPGDSNR